MRIIAVNGEIFPMENIEETARKYLLERIEFYKKLGYKIQNSREFIEIRFHDNKESFERVYGREVSETQFGFFQKDGFNSCSIHIRVNKSDIWKERQRIDLFHELEHAAQWLTGFPMICSAKYEYRAHEIYAKHFSNLLNVKEEDYDFHLKLLELSIKDIKTQIKLYENMEKYEKAVNYYKDHSLRALKNLEKEFLRV